MKVGNQAALFLWEWALSPDKNNHRARALSTTAPHFWALLLPHYLHADLFMFSHTLISICIKPGSVFCVQQTCRGLSDLVWTFIYFFQVELIDGCIGPWKSIQTGN